MAQGRTTTTVSLGRSYLLMEDNPYAPPASSLNAASGPALVGTGTPFRDLSDISRKLSILLLVGAGWQILDCVSSLMQLNLLSRPVFSTAEANANDLRERLVGIGELILVLITASVFGRWIYLAHKNLPELGARYLRATPGWVGGSFFVPIVSLWAPYKAMRDLTKASRNPSHWELEDTSPLVVIWWVLWIIVQILGNGTLRASLHADTVQQLQELTVMQIVADVLSLPLYI